MTKTNIRDILFFGDTKGVELVLALSSILWFVLLIWPGETFSRPTYVAMAKIMTEEAWALSFLTHGVGLLYFMRDKSVNLYMRYINNFLGGLLWVSSSLMMLFAITPPPAAISGELILSIGSLWVFIRTDIGTKL